VVLRKIVTLLVLSSLILSFGCISQIGSFGCQFAPEDDKDHCYQFAAKEAGDPSLCEKIKGEGFKGSNPPKDKCYLQVANKTKDASHCANMQGGFYSYEPSECYQMIAKENQDPELCKNVPKFDGSYDTMNINQGACLSGAGASPDYFDSKDTEDKESIKQENQDSETDESKEDTQEKTDSDKEDDSKTTTQDTDATKNAESKKSNPDSDDSSSKTKTPQEDVKKTSADEQTKPQETKTTSESKTKQAESPKPKTTEQIKASAEADISKINAEIKGQLEKQEKIPIPPTEPQKQPGYLERAWNWVGWGAQKGSDALGDNAPDSMKKVGKGKEIYDYGQDVIDAKSSFDNVNKEVEKKTVSKGRGKLLKVGYGLGKGVKWIASKVPIIGDTAGTIADESFKATMGFGKKLAKRATKQDKCIDDPLADECID
jgi:hypothetical protein